MIVGLVLCCAAPSGCGHTEGVSGDSAAQASPSAGENAAPVEPKDGREALELMVAAYQKATSYADSGKARLIADQADRKMDETVDFSVTVVRPNKIRAHVYQAMVVCDGQHLHASIQTLAHQVLQRKAPEKLTLHALFADRVLAAAMTQGFAGSAPPLMFLLGDDPLKAILQDAEPPELKEPGTIGDRPCHRIQIRRPEGLLVLWVDRQTFVLRRVVFPTDELRRAMSQDGPVQSVSLVADFDGAELNGTVDPKAFQFEMPADAKIVKFLETPHPAQLLGKKTPDFKFADLAGKPVTPKSLEGKVAVLDFWATWCGPCRETLPNLEKVYQQFKGNDKVAIVAVSVDDPKTANEELQKTFEGLKVTVPVVRESETSAGMLFHFTGIPSLFILGPDGVVQDFQEGADPNLARLLPEKIEKLLGGENIYEKPLREYQQQLQQYEESMTKIEHSPPPEKSDGDTMPLPETKIAERSQPALLKLAPLWKCTELKAPGNLLRSDAGSGKPPLLAVESWRSVVEIGADGKPGAAFELKIDDKELITHLRVAATRDGRRFLAAFAAAQQRMHLLDGQGNLLWSYPPDALENPHPGIADVQLADLDGDGSPEVYVSYWGVVGVQAVGLDGQLLWKNRLITNVSSMTVTSPDAQGQRHLLCTNMNGSLAALDAKGQRQNEVSFAGRPLRWVTGAEFPPDRQRLFCALTGTKLGENIAVGVALDGKELWSYTLPEGVPAQPIEAVVPGRLKMDGTGHWLIGGADGSIHVLSADGKLVDRFNYGTPLCGLATLEITGQPALVVSTPGGIEAWKVQW